MSSFVVDPVVDGEDTLIAFLAARLPSMKRGTIKDRLRDGGVLVNGVVTTRATTPLARGDTVELRRDGARPVTPGGRVPILHVDDDIVVVDKPAEVLSVEAGRGADKTVASLVAPLLPRPRGAKDNGLFACHRLDRGTSGVLLLARSEAMRDRMFAQWASVQKTYVAVLDGVMMDDSGTVDAPLLEHPRSLSVKVSDEPGARDAVTHFRVLGRSARHTLVELIIDTGRKHQIRVHMLHLGHPVAGDERYGSSGAQAPRLCLHAHRLAFAHPRTGAALSFESTAPALFTSLVPTRM